MIEHLKTRAKRLDSAIPEVEDFTENILNDSAVLLALLMHLAKNNGRSFPGEKLLATSGEPLEVQHLFPRAVLDSWEEKDNQYIPDRIGNLTIIVRSDNEHLSDMPPEKYLPTITSEIREIHLIPDDPELWTVSNYPTFCLRREELLGNAIRQLLDKLLGS